MRDAWNGLSDKDKNGVKLFGVAGLIFVSLATFYGLAASSPENKYDPVTLCNSELPRAEHSLFLVDISDSLSVHQRDFVTTYFGSVLDKAAVNDRFSIYILDERSRGLSDPIIDLCKPRSADDVNALTANKRFVEKIYSEKFYQPLQQSIEKVVEANELKISPIYESISDIASLGRGDDKAEKVKLILVSDMLQHSQAGSVYSAGAAAVEKLPSVNLQDIEVKVFWLDRPEASRIQTAALASSWASYLDKISEFDRIERVRH